MFQMERKLNIKSSTSVQVDVLPQSQRKLLLIISFVEGAAVMSIELRGAKIGAAV